MDKVDLSFLQIEPSTKCNYTCGFCVGRHMPQKHIDFDVFKGVIESVEGLRHISIQGEGEPLLNPNFFHMVQFVKERHPGISISFITNGSMFTSRAIQQILSLGVARIMVSIESADPATFQTIRGGKLDKVKRGVTTLLDHKRKLGLERPVLGFALTLLKSTVKDIKGVVSLYNELGMDGGIAVQYLQRMDSYVSIYDQHMVNELLDNSDITVFEQYRDSDYEFSSLIERANSESNFYTSLFNSDTPGCPWLSNALYVNANGHASGCCQMKDAHRDGFGMFNLESRINILRQRSDMQKQLLLGVVPRGCENCAVAASVSEKANF